MSERPERTPDTLVRLSVPPDGDLRAIVAAVAAKVAEYIGRGPADPGALGTAIDDVAARVSPQGTAADITFEFRQSDDGLVIEARSGGRSSEVRCPLPA